MTTVFVLPSSDPSDYSANGVAALISKIVNPKGKRGFYTVDNRPTWWPADIEFCSPNSKKKGPEKAMPVRETRKILAAFFENCRDCYRISPDIKETEMEVLRPTQINALEEPAPQPPVKAIKKDPTPSPPAKELLQHFERLLEELEQRALDAEQKEAAAQLMLAGARKRVLSLERKLCELANDNDTLQEELVLIAGIAKRSRFM